MNLRIGHPELDQLDQWRQPPATMAFRDILKNKYHKAINQKKRENKRSQDHQKYQSIEEYKVSKFSIAVNYLIEDSESMSHQNW